MNYGPKTRRDLFNLIAQAAKESLRRANGGGDSDNQAASFRLHNRDDKSVGVVKTRSDRQCPKTYYCIRSIPDGRLGAVPVRQDQGQCKAALQRVRGGRYRSAVA